jgi:transcriptional regulator with XRE-family HTH domain
MPRRGCQAADARVGTKLRQFRIMRGLSQTELGKELRVSFQQIQKYERGSNRISAGQLQEFARILEVPLTSFFADGETEPGPHALQSREVLELVRDYLEIRDERVRQQILRLIGTLARVPVPPESLPSPIVRAAK